MSRLCTYRGHPPCSAFAAGAWRAGPERVVPGCIGCRAISAATSAWLGRSRRLSPAVPARTVFPGHPRPPGLTNQSEGGINTPTHPSRRCCAGSDAAAGQGARRSAYGVCPPTAPPRQDHPRGRYLQPPHSMEGSMTRMMTTQIDRRPLCAGTIPDPRFSARRRAWTRFREQRFLEVGVHNAIVHQAARRSTTLR